MIDKKIDKILSAWREPTREQESDFMVTERREPHICHSPKMYTIKKQVAGRYIDMFYIECVECGLKTEPHIYYNLTAEEWENLVRYTKVFKRIITTPDGEQAKYLFERR